MNEPASAEKRLHDATLSAIWDATQAEKDLLEVLMLYGSSPQEVADDAGFKHPVNANRAIGMFGKRVYDSGGWPHSEPPKSWYMVVSDWDGARWILKGPVQEALAKVMYAPDG